MKLPRGRGVNGSFDWQLLDKRVPKDARVVIRYHALRKPSGKISWTGEVLSNDETEWRQLVPDLETYRHYFDIDDLRRIEWSSLKTPFGNDPSQFPYMLCALTSSDSLVRREAMNTLNTIEYNGSISTATYPTVRFLLKLVQNGTLPDRTALLDVLLSVACAEYYHPGNISLDPVDESVPLFGHYREAYQAYFAIGEAIPFFLILLTHAEADVRRLSKSILSRYEKTSQHD